MNSHRCLIGDIGGTNARFALARANRPGYLEERVYACADHPSLEQAVRAYLDDVGLQGTDSICLAVAGPIVGGAVQFTNSRWRISEDPLRAAFATNRVRLINDFEAVAYALPLLGQDDYHVIGEPPPPDLTRAHYTVGVLGPGTGLGAAGLLRRGGLTAALACEAGHVGFAPETPVQRELLVRLQGRYERVSDERVASGAGLENIHWALNPGRDGKMDAAQIFAQAHSGDAAATRSVGLFFELLGQVAGNLALSMGAFQGIYIAGGIVGRHLPMLPASRFRSGFENKGRHRAIMEKIPTLVIKHPQPGLLGASEVTRQSPDPF